MSTCTRSTVDGRRCLNRSERGDCGRHTTSAATVADVMSAAPDATVADPFSGAAAWRERSEYTSTPDTTAGWGQSLVGRAADRAEAAIARARQVCAADPDLLEVLDDLAMPDRPTSSDRKYQWSGRTDETRLKEDQGRWDRLHGDPDPAWTEIRRLVVTADTVHLPDVCDTADGEPQWGACADHADKAFCRCVSGFVPHLPDLQARLGRARQRQHTAETAARLAEIDSFDAATARELIPSLANHYGGVGIWRAALWRRARATVDPETADWVLRLAVRLDESVDLHDHDTSSRLAEAMRDAVVIHGIADPAELVERAVKSVDGPFTRKATLTKEAQRIAEAAAAWASGSEPAGHHRPTGPTLPGRYHRVGLMESRSHLTIRPDRGINTRDPRHSMLFVLAEAATDGHWSPFRNARRDGSPAALVNAHRLADSVASTRQRLGDRWVQVHGRRHR